MPAQSAATAATVAPLLAQADAGLGTSFTYLFLGTLAAVGAALALGTLAAIVRYHRTGAFPGNEPGQEVTTRRYAGLWVRVVLGVAIGIYGLAVVMEAGIV